ncbi:MAG: SUMF1/EgtB/PvdO family nonheme iron enzyme [Candidatus Hodarchaeota archaeon]
MTVGQWRRFVQETGFKTEAERDGRVIVLRGENWEEKSGYYWDNPGFRQTDNHPVTCVSWNGVQAFIRWLSMKGKEQYRLPSEAEWEYACRAGTETACFWGDNPDDACMYANVHDLTSKRVNQFRQTHHDCDDRHAVVVSVGSFRPNPFGLYDMLGNIYEWCEDRAEWRFKIMTNTYRDGIVDPLCTNGSLRIIRGGSWDSGRMGVCCAARVRHPPDIRISSQGCKQKTLGLHEKILIMDIYSKFFKSRTIRWLTTILLVSLMQVYERPCFAQERRPSRDPIVVQVIHLDYADAEHLASILAPFLSKEGRIVAYSPTNSLIIRDRKSLVKKLVKIIKGDFNP